MEIAFPIEFSVPGTPVSFQAKSAAAKLAWKDRVRAASLSALPQPHFASGKRMSVVLYYLPQDRVEGDVDNIVKLVLDAMSAHIYLDDAQVERVVVQKFEPGNLFQFSNPSAGLVAALTGEKSVLYVRVSNDPFEDLQ
jgi:hypothetical protein